MKKIALFAPSLRGGGAERVFTTLASRFTKKGYEVDLVLVNATGPYLKDLPDTVNVVDLQSKRVLFSLPLLVKYLKIEKPDVLLSTLGHANVVALLAARLAGFKGRVVIRQANMQTRVEGRKITIKGKTSSYLLKKICSGAAAVITLNKTMAEEFYQETGIEKEKLFIINNPVDIDSISLQAQKPINHPWFQDNSQPVLLSAGRLTAQKNISILIKAFAKIQKKLNARLVLLGEGELRDELLTLVNELGLQESVDFLGFNSNPYAFMSRASLFILPSRWEGFPNALVEAMACGSPVIASDCPGGSAEILGGGEWGELVPVDDVDALAVAITKVLSRVDHPDVQQRVKYFSVETVADKYLDVLFGEVTK